MLQTHPGHGNPRRSVCADTGVCGGIGHQPCAGTPGERLVVDHIAKGAPGGGPMNEEISMRNVEREPEAATAAVQVPLENLSGAETKTVLPILPLRDTVLFPGTILPLNVGRESSLRLLEESLPQGKLLGLVLQKNSQSENPSLEELHQYGAIGRVVRMIRQGEKNAVVIVHGENRMRITKVLQQEPFMKAEVEVLASNPIPQGVDLITAAVRNLRESAERLLELRPDVPDEMKAVLAGIEDTALLTDIIAANLSIEATAKQKLLEEPDVARRVAALQVHLDNQLHIAELQSKLRENVQSE